MLPDEAGVGIDWTEEWDRRNQVDAANIDQSVRRVTSLNNVSSLDDICTFTNKREVAGTDGHGTKRYRNCSPVINLGPRTGQRLSGFDTNVSFLSDSEVYIPSWILNAPSESLTCACDSSMEKAQKSGPFSDSTKKSDMATINLKKINRTSHEDLEREYLKLRTKLSLKPNDGGIQRTEIQDLDKRSENTEGSSQEARLDLKTSDFFSSDSLGINHFRKHIQNVKTTSRRFKRARQANQRTVNKRVPNSFKPLYECEPLDRTSFHGR